MTSSSPLRSKVWPNSRRAHYYNAVVGEYWQALGIGLVEGRLLEDADNHRKERVCVVDQAFVRRYFGPGESPLGRRLNPGPAFSENAALTIVGVFDTVKQHDLADAQPAGTIYCPYAFWNGGTNRDFSVVVRAGGMSPEALAPALQQAVLRLNPELPLYTMKPLHDRIDDSLVARSPRASPARRPLRRSRAAFGGHRNLRSIELCGGAATARDRHQNGAGRAPPADQPTIFLAGLALASRRARSSASSGRGSPAVPCKACSTMCPRCTSRPWPAPPPCWA